MKKLNGVVETHYGNGQLQSRETYEDDELNGLCETWYDNGQPQTLNNIRNFHGLFFIYRVTCWCLY